MLADRHAVSICDVWYGVLPELLHPWQALVRGCALHHHAVTAVHVDGNLSAPHNARLLLWLQETGEVFIARALFGQRT